MSGLGTITSRTIVSPNSMIWWMSWRSSRSITSSSTAASAMASSSCSDRNGPCLRPFPGDEHVGQADQGPGEKSHRRELDDGGDDRGDPQHGAIGMLDGERLRHRLGEDEDHDDLEHDCEQHTQGSGPPLRQDAHEAGCGQVAQQHEQQDGVEELLGVLDQAEQLLAALLALLGEGQGPDPVGAGERRLRAGQHCGHADEHEHPANHQPRGVHQLTTSSGVGPPVAGEPDFRWNLSRSSCSRFSIASASGPLSWSIPSTWRTPWTTSRAISSS